MSWCPQALARGHILHPSASHFEGGVHRRFRLEGLYLPSRWPIHESKKRSWPDSTRRKHLKHIIQKSRNISIRNNFYSKFHSVKSYLKRWTIKFSWEQLELFKSSKNRFFESSNKNSWNRRTESFQITLPNVLYDCHVTIISRLSVENSGRAFLKQLQLKINLTGNIMSSRDRFMICQNFPKIQSRRYNAHDSPIKSNIY